ncbi:unnamed protein product [Thelazia callipaeda]|uniref:RING-type domain-containing protein n=1 Tax=Thelazia callipaeda TaxID=103827 RepID=A0A0N5DA36_THECL|nr:unnamed protein product [Thelazia callipaeda]
MLGTEEIFVPGLKDDTVQGEADDLSYLGVAPEAKRSVSIPLLSTVLLSVLRVIFVSSKRLDMMRCTVCMRDVPVGKMVQFTPCLHVFCKACVDRWRLLNEEKLGKPRSPTSPSKKTLTPVICLASNCYSVYEGYYVRRLNWKQCDSPFCSRKLSAVRLEPLSCDHNLCVTCMEGYKRLANPVCPVQGCPGKANEDDDAEICDGICKQLLEQGKFVTMKCCQAKICNQCFEAMFGRKITAGSTICSEEKCPFECVRLSDFSEPVIKCTVGSRCNNVAINGFPSKGECDHTVCMRCLEEMIEECETVGSLPHCNNHLCNALYGTDSVMAMRAMFPHKAAFFEKLWLDNKWCYTIKDETVTALKLSTEFKSADRFCEINIRLNDEIEVRKLPFDREGTIADLLREVRRELKIAPEEKVLFFCIIRLKVYGYYLIRSSSLENHLDKPAERLELSSAAITETIGKLNLSRTTTIVVDTAGIVQAKEEEMLTQ